MSNDPLVLAKNVAKYLSSIDSKGIDDDNIVELREVTGKAWRLVKMLEERDGGWPRSAPVMLARVAPEPRVKSVTVTVNFEE